MKKQEDKIGGVKSFLNRHKCIFISSAIFLGTIILIFIATIPPQESGRELMMEDLEEGLDVLIN